MNNNNNKFHDIFIVGSTGSVGKELVKQVTESHDMDLKKHAHPTRIIGLASSKGYVFSPEGIEKNLAKKFSNRKGNSSTKYDSLDEILSRVRDDCSMENSIISFIDVTAGKEELKKFHLDIIENSKFNIVTANKNPIALSDYSIFKKLTESPIRYGYKCSVMAGAESINFLQRLRDISDPINSIEGCFSGTLGYICSELDKGEKKFSDIVKIANQSGYTEPHPRDDLNGLDVARKLLILGRTAGYGLELKDIELEAMIPKELEYDDINEFFEGLKTLDDDYKRKVDMANKNGNVLRYVASFDSKKDNQILKVGLQEVSKNSPLGSLNGTLNKIVVNSGIYNTRYAVEAPGAGLEVTAANIRMNLLDQLEDRRYLI
ncbi:MAG: hypothetical protein KC550_00930 [Nanoarchaeota archaeon]|nr:hypothetical protein [Nanoarchaeota archaeon]